MAGGCWWKRPTSPSFPNLPTCSQATSTFHSTLFLVYQLALPGGLSVEDPSLDWGEEEEAGNLKTDSLLVAHPVLSIFLEGKLSSRKQPLSLASSVKFHF